MMRFIVPIIFVGIAITVFFTFTNPIYNDISTLRAQVASYNNALDNSKMLENERDKLTAKYNTIDPNNLTKLQKLLPGSVDNIRLILEIEQIASPYGITLKDVKYNATDTNTSTNTSAAASATVQRSGIAELAPKDYGVFDLEFSTSGTYNNFINFIKDMESNLRIVDISSILFSSDTTSAGANLKTTSPEAYKYNFRIKTYWLKN
ncbi:MAG: hypothetical protein AAB902_01770 [Patescibacteria group bacterium]